MSIRVLVIRSHYVVVLLYYLSTKYDLSFLGLRYTIWNTSSELD